MSYRTFALSLLISSSAVHASPLLDTQGMTFEQIKQAGMNDPKKDKDCCYGFAAAGQPIPKIPVKESYYVKVTVDVEALAQDTLTFSCILKGFFKPSRRCDDDELAKKLQDATKADAYYGNLYGKYKNTWLVYDADGKALAATTKFGGHSPYYFKRNGKTDTVLLGPLPKKPAIIEVSMQTSEEGVPPSRYKRQVQW